MKADLAHDGKQWSNPSIHPGRDGFVHKMEKPTWCPGRYFTNNMFYACGFWWGMQPIWLCWWAFLPCFSLSHGVELDTIHIYIYVRQTHISIWVNYSDLSDLTGSWLGFEESSPNGCKFQSGHGPGKGRWVAASFRFVNKDMEKYLGFTNISFRYPDIYGENKSKPQGNQAPCSDWW